MCYMTVITVALGAQIKAPTDGYFSLNMKKKNNKNSDEYFFKRRGS